jgi:hypothetical protein
MVHAEAGAADIAYKQSKAIEKMPDLEFQAELLNQEGITRRIEDLEVMIGISKLCCFHCLLLIRAMSKVAGIEMAVSGSHFNTYNWPVAEVLSTPEVLAAFLGLDEASKSPYAEFLLEAMKTEDGRRAIIIGIKEAKKLGGGDTTTDYISSEDEASDALGLTLARDEGARQGAVRHTRAPRVKKQNDDETEFEMFTDEDDEVDDDGNVIEDKEKKRKRKTKARQSTVIKRRLPVVEVTESNKRRRTRSAGAAEEKRTLVPVRRTNDDNSDSEPGSGSDG